MFWALISRLRSRKDNLHANRGRDDRSAPADLHCHDKCCCGNNGHHVKVNRVYPRGVDKNGQLAFALNIANHHDNKIITNHHHHRQNNNAPAYNPARFLSVRPLFEPKDLRLVEYMQGQGLTNVRELVNIMMPVILSLGFCPLTLLLHSWIVDCLWPPSLFSSAPNINDAIACFLVPAGMVYAISFGFAFQQVSGAFRETEVTFRNVIRRQIWRKSSCPWRSYGNSFHLVGQMLP